MTKKTHTGLIAVEMDLTRICSGPGVGFSTSFTTSKGAFASLVMAAFIFPLFFFVSCDIYTCYYQNLKGVVDPMYIGPCVFVYSFRTICTLYTKALSRAHCGMLCKNSVEACNLISRVERQDDEIPLT